MSSSEKVEAVPIPYLCVLTLVRLDLLKRLIDSIDYPVNNVVILFQGNVKRDKFNLVNTFVKRFIFISSNMNIGVSRGWNYFLKNFPSHYWLISGDDCFFEPSSLEHIAKFMSIPSSLENVFCGLKIKNRNNVPADFFNTFVVTKLLLEKVGLFDENIYPAYYEDTDLWHRIQLTKQKVATIDRAYINSGDDKHTGSCTLNSVTPIYRQKMDQCYKQNEIYYKTKWNIEGTNKFKYPFNNPKFDVKNNRIPHINYFKNQKILLGHTNAPTFTIL
jgi:GT2 family glycosyltransferase